MSAPSVYKLWLNLQCQMVTGCTEGILVKHLNEGKDRIVAQWPEGSTINKPMILGAKNVSEQRRLHMVKDNKDGVYLAHPIELNNVYWGSIVLHINQRTPSVVQAVIKLLKWGFTWLHVVNSALATNPKNKPQESSSNEHLLTLISKALQDQSLEETAITSVNQIASAFQFDRVSLGLLSNEKLKLQAISFNAQFDKRSEYARQITQAMNEAIAQGSSVEFPTQEDTEVISLQHKELAKKHSAKYCATFLLTNQNINIGAICVERNHLQPLSQEERKKFIQHLESIAALVALRNSPSASIKLGQPNRTSSIKRKLLAPRALQKLFIVAALSLVIIGFVPAKYHIKGDAVMQSNNRHLLAVPFDGYLAEVMVRPGDKVTRNQPLAKLKDEDLVLERRKLASQLQQYQLEYNNALAEGSRAQAAIVTARVDQTRVQLDLVKQKLDRTLIVSPADGTVISDDIRQSIGAPIQQGKVLFEISNAEDFSVQIYINEKDIAFIKNQQIGELYLTSLPGQIIELAIQQITPISEVKDGNNFFRVEAKLDQSKIQDNILLRPGMRGTSKILIEPKPLGWIWFHDIWHWLRRVFWF